MAAAEFLTTTMIVAFSRVIDGEMRVRDLELAMWLGHADIYKIRKRIEGHRAELESKGLLATVAKSSGGRPGIEFWLNYQQALIICMVSDAPNAIPVRGLLAELAERAKDGNLLPLSPSDTALIKSIAAVDLSVNQVDQKIERGFGQMNGRLQQLETRQDRIEENQQDLIRCFRRNPTSAQRRFLFYVIWIEFKGCCPICRQPILDQHGNPLESARIDHWHGKWSRALENLWVICEPCNLHRENARDREFQDAAQKSFNYFQHVMEKHKSVSYPVSVVGEQNSLFPI